ncbi:MAG: hypothetical protein JXR61_01615 [Prolixibacteraceae bacterium]|nr:hypothetical protein [Prolixibacteraceae bacterium]
MAKKKVERLADRIEKEQAKMNKEFKKLPLDEQEKLKEGQKRLFKKWDNQPWY